MGCANVKSTRIHSAIQTSPVKADSSMLAIHARSMSEPGKSVRKVAFDMPLTPVPRLHTKTLKFTPDTKSSLKIRPPLVKLPAYNVNAITLSFMGYFDEVFALLCLLNKNS